MVNIHSVSALINPARYIHREAKTTERQPHTSIQTTTGPIMPPLKASQVVQVRVAPTLFAAIQSEDAFAEENWAKKRRSKQAKTPEKPLIPMITPVVKKQP